MTNRPTLPSAHDSIFEDELTQSDLPAEARGIAYVLYAGRVENLHAPHEENDLRAAAKEAIQGARSEQFAEEESDRFAGGGSREDALAPYVDRPVWIDAGDDEKESFIHGLLSNQLQRIDGEDPRELALQAMDVARERFNDTYQGYLSWLWLRYEGKTASEIAEEEKLRGKTTTAATVRGGWRHANARLLDIIHELRFHRHAHLSGEVDPRLRAIEAMLDEPERLEEASRHLDLLREDFRREPRWHILKGKVNRRRGHLDDALAEYREACLWARDNVVRGEAHNAMGYAYDKANDRDNALAHWRMATDLAPELQKPWFNLMADASLHKDLVECKRLIQRFTGVVHGGKMSDSDRQEALTTLKNKADPELRWIRAQDEWRRVYQTWLKKLAVAVAVAAAIMLFALLPRASQDFRGCTALAAKGEAPSVTWSNAAEDVPIDSAKGEVIGMRTVLHAKGERQV